MLALLRRAARHALAPKSYHRAREGADEDELLEAAGYLVDFGEAEWADEDGWPHQLEMDE